MKIKYFVISLPRTGTTSLSKMARMCGLNPKHAPHFYWKDHIKNNVFDFFSDTPIYSPQVIKEICEMENLIPKFIYIDRDYASTFKSWTRMRLLDNYYGYYGNNEVFDFVSYDQAFQGIKLTDKNYEEIFSNHKEIVYKITKDYSKEVLIYNFDMGWLPFCDFLECEIPDAEIPKLNTNSFFDPY